MNPFRIGLISFVGFLSAHAHAADLPATYASGPAIPILAWGGIPWNEMNDARFIEFAEAGFTHSYSGSPNADQMEKILDLAHAHGVKQLISTPELENDPEGTAKRFKDHPGIAGYYLRDEPDAGLFGKLGTWAKRIQGVDPKNPCYVNLLPTYAEPSQLGTPDYAKYLERFVAEVPVPMLSFDHYSVIGADGKEAGHQLRGDYYLNLELASAAARKASRPLWAFALSTAHGAYPVATIPALRLQAFSNLAYGAQAIQYFTYWTTKSPDWNFHAGPIDVDGKRTPTYDRVKQVNSEIQSLRAVFLGSTVIAVGHTGKTLPAGTKPYAPAGPVKSLDAGGVVVSRLEKGPEQFLAVVNRSLQTPMPLRIEFDPSAKVCLVKKDGSTAPLADDRYDAPLDPGDIAVFAWTVY